MDSDSETELYGIDSLKLTYLGKESNEWRLQNRNGGGNFFSKKYKVNETNKEIECNFWMEYVELWNMWRL